MITFVLEMRILTLILSIVILTSSMIPCMDHSDKSEGDVELVLHDCSDHNQSDNDEELPCSPFCYCQCNQIPSYYQPLEITGEEIVINTNSNNFEYINTYCFRYSHETWHPPTLS